MADHNSLGFIFFLSALSVGFTAISGVMKRGTAADATPEDLRKLILSIITLPLLGVALSLTYPHYHIGLVGAGVVLGLVLTLQSITTGISALSTEPMVVGILYMMSRRSTTGDAASAMEEVMSRFGYFLTQDHLGLLTGGILGGIVLGALPRLAMKSRQVKKSKSPKPRARRQQSQQSPERNNAPSGTAVFSKKSQKSGLADRIKSIS